MLSIQDTMEELSYAYTHAVAARAGYSVTRPAKDRDSVDAYIESRSYIAPDSKIASTIIGVQLKATWRADLSKPEFSFDLPVKNYDDLRIETMNPRLLVVLVLPRAKEEWLSANEDALISRRCAYWTSILGHAPTTNKKTRAVRLKRANRFDPGSLKELMARASRFEGISP